MELCLESNSGIIFNKLIAKELCYRNLLINLLFNYQNDLVHGWGIDFAFWRCVKVKYFFLMSW